MAYPHNIPDTTERKPTILIVEDEVLIRLALADYLQECAFKVFEAANATEAIEILRSDQAAIDVVLTDVHLSGEMNGFGLAAWVRSNGHDVAFILTSGDSRMATAAKELCEHHSFVRKPYDLATVVRHVRSLVDARRARRPAISDKA
jgi:DNA-binding NtrC family response regulator